MRDGRTWGLCRLRKLGFTAVAVESYSEPRLLVPVIETVNLRRSRGHVASLSRYLKWRRPRRGLVASLGRNVDGDDLAGGL